MTWYYKGEEINEIPEGAIGYVYLITRSTDGKKYIGKKNFYFAKTKQVKLKKKRYKVESDWKDYYGSSEILKKSVEELGPDKFLREILRVCYSKAEFGYWEAYYQFTSHCILKPDEFLNEWVSVRVRRAHMKNTLDFNSKTI